MKKKIILICLFVTVAFITCACGMENIEENKNDRIGIFKRYQDYPGGNVIIDTETNVMYWISTGAYNNGTLTLLVEADGSPKIYNGEGR